MDFDVQCLKQIKLDYRKNSSYFIQSERNDVIIGANLVAFESNNNNENTQRHLICCILKHESASIDLEM